MKHKTSLQALILAAGVATAGGLTFANQTGDTEAIGMPDLARTSISLVEAVGSAESHTGGRATKAELDAENGVALYKVEVVNADNQLLDVTVDAVDGRVLSSKFDRADGEDDEED